MIVQPIPLGVSFSKAQSSKLERLFCHVSVKRDVRALRFELWNSIRKCHLKCDQLYLRYISDRFINIPHGSFWVSPCTGEQHLHPYLSLSIEVDLLSDGDSVSTNVNLFENLGTPVKTCLIYGVLRHSVLRRCLKTVAWEIVSRQRHSLHTVFTREVGGWGRDPKKCTGRGWGMGSSTI